MTSAAEPGPLIGAGRAADVFDIGDGRVLRRNRNGASTEIEAEVMTHVRAHGYPVPEVFDADGGDLVMERIDGTSMLDLFARRPWRSLEWARLLASLVQRLAEVPLPDFALPVRIGAPEVLMHGDLHPGNVLMADAGPVVIDWPNAGLASLGADIASTWVLVATSNIDATGLVGALQRGARSRFLAAFLHHAGRDTGRSVLAEAGAHRLEDRNVMPEEAERIHALLRREGVG